MNRLIVAVILSGLCIFSTSCYYDSEEALYPTLSSSCDTTTVTFSGTIVPQLRDNCYSCHSNANSAMNGNNISLQDYADVVTMNVAMAAAMKHTGNYVPMPKNGGKVSDCMIKQFDIWVQDGMPDN